MKGIRRRISASGRYLAYGPHRFHRVPVGFRRSSRARRRTGGPGAADGRTGPFESRVRAGGRRYHRVQDEFNARDGYNIEAHVGTVLSGLGFARPDWQRRAEEFSGGWQMRIALAKLLLEKPNLLLLDEPTNHLDLEARNWLESIWKLSERLRADFARPLFPGRDGRENRRDLEQARSLLYRRLSTNTSS